MPFQKQPAAIDEDAVKQSLLAEGASSADIADALAELKAVRVSARNPDALALGADQVLEFDGDLISKCESLEAAAALLRRLRGQRHCLITAAVMARGGAPIWRHLSRANLTMRDFSDAFLDDYLDMMGDHALGSVGGYQLEGIGVHLFARVEGDYFTILGLPLLPLLDFLRQNGFVAG